jgi:hypothetical protein
MSQGGCGELLEIKAPGELESWNPTLRKVREGWATRHQSETEETDVHTRPLMIRDQTKCEWKHGGSVEMNTVSASAERNKPVSSLVRP